MLAASLLHLPLPLLTLSSAQVYSTTKSHRSRAMMPTSPGNLDTANALPSAMIAQHVCPHLPVEVWVQIIQHVDDDYALWVIYRQVERTFRAEAEREFGVTRLPFLKISWSSVVEIQHQGRLHEYGCIVNDMQLQRLIEDCARAQFSVQFIFYLFDNRNLETVDNHDWKQCGSCKAVLVNLIAFRDLDFQERCRIKYPTTQTAKLGYYVNEAEVTGLVVEIAQKTLAFDWKAFLNDLYKITTYVETRKQIKERVSDRAEQSLEKLRHPDWDSNTLPMNPYGKWCYHWWRAFGAEDDDCYTEAYFRRLQSVYNQAGLILYLANIAEDSTEEDIRRDRNCLFAKRRLSRNCVLIDDYHSKHNITVLHGI